MSQLGIPEDFFECGLFKKKAGSLHQFPLSFRFKYCRARIDRYLRGFPANRFKAVEEHREDPLSWWALPAVSARLVLSEGGLRLVLPDPNGSFSYMDEPSKKLAQVRVTMLLCRLKLWETMIDSWSMDTTFEDLVLQERLECPCVPIGVIVLELLCSASAVPMPDGSNLS